VVRTVAAPRRQPCWPALLLLHVAGQLWTLAQLRRERNRRRRRNSPIA
jgi:hypothetical protein